MAPATSNVFLFPTPSAASESFRGSSRHFCAATAHSCIVALIDGQIVAGRGGSSAQVISEAVEAAVRIFDAAEAAVAAPQAPGR